MKDKDRVALAKIVIAHRKHVIALEPLGKGLLGTTLRYAYEVRDEKDYFSEVPSPRVSRDMVNLAAHILASKETKKFDPRKFKDDYEKALRNSIRRKAGAVTTRSPRRPRRRGQCHQLDGRLAAKPGEARPGGSGSQTPRQRGPSARARPHDGNFAYRRAPMLGASTTMPAAKTRAPVDEIIVACRPLMNWPLRGGWRWFMNRHRSN